MHGYAQPRQRDADFQQISRVPDAHHQFDWPHRDVIANGKPLAAVPHQKIGHRAQTIGFANAHSIKIGQHAHGRRAVEGETKKKRRRSIRRPQRSGERDNLGTCSELGIRVSCAAICAQRGRRLVADFNYDSLIFQECRIRCTISPNGWARDG